MCRKWTPTAVAPPIPLEDITPLERLLLSLILDAKDDGRRLDFRARSGPSEILTLSRSDLAEALQASAHATGSIANEYVVERFGTSAMSHGGDPFDDFDLDMTGTSWEFILQDIVRRSSTIDEIVVKAATMSDGPLFDDLAGSVTLITATAIKSKSTDEVLEELRQDALVVTERTIDAGMSLWIAARDFRQQADRQKPLQRSIHRMLDTWEQVGGSRMRNWMMAIADDAVQVAKALETEPDAQHWSFGIEIAPSVLEAFDWYPDGPYIPGCDADFIANVLEGVRRRWPQGTDVF